MVKKINYDITDEQIEEIGELKGKVFLEFIKLSESGEDAIFTLLAKESLKQIFPELPDDFDPSEEYSFGVFTKLMVKIMEVNNLNELFQGFERLNRNTAINK
jgi:hypothetical protein